MKKMHNRSVDQPTLPQSVKSRYLHLTIGIERHVVFKENHAAG